MKEGVIDTTLERTYGFYELSLGKKVVMAATGAVLFGYVIAHMLGNLQVFVGAEQMNRYAGFLHSQRALLWSARIVLLVAVGLHILTSLQLWNLKRKARPEKYYKKDDVPAAYAARTMMWSGPIIAAFVVFHVLHLTTGTLGLGFQAPEALPAGHEQFYAYENVVAGFRYPLVSIAYIFAVVLLSVHLYHGLWAMFQSVGYSHPRHTPALQNAARAVAIVIAAGYISIPVAVMAGLVGAEVR